MARRNLLHKSKLADFKEWLSMNGIQWRDGKGSYQVIQVNTGCGWTPIYDSSKERREHFTTQDALRPLVNRFIREAAK